MSGRALVPLLVLWSSFGCEREPKPSTTSAIEGGVHDCDELAKAYQSALAQAKRCAPVGGKSCRTAVANRLGCACNTFVSSSNPKLLEAMRRLERRWTEQMCGHSVGCVPTRCPEAQSAECAPSGRCVDDGT